MMVIHWIHLMVDLEIVENRKQFKGAWELAGDESELDIWPEIPEEYKDLDKKDLCPESCVSHDEDIPF